MFFLLTSFSIIGWFQGLRMFTSRNLDALWLPFTLVAAVSTIYFASLVNLLYPASVLLLTGGIALLIWDLSLRILKRSQQSFWTPGLIFFISLSALYCLRYLNASLHVWDEFGWGLASKDIFLRHGLFVENSAVTFKNYPPGGALLHYFFLFGGNFSEGVAYCSMAFLFISCFVPLVELAPRKIWAYGIIVASCFYLKAGVGEGHLQLLMMDCLFGSVLGAGAILSYFVLKEVKLKLFLIPFLIFIVLLKPTGIVLSGSFFLIILLAASIELFSSQHRPFKIWLDYLWVMLAILAAPLLTYASWGWWKGKINAVEIMASPKLTISELVNAFFGMGTERQIEIFNIFFSRLPQSKFFAWFLGFTLFFVVIFYLAPQRSLRRFFGAIYFSFSLGWLIFLSAHFFAYLFIFSDFEAKGLVSFERYQSPWIIAFLMASLTSAFFLKQHLSQKSRIPFILSGALYLAIAAGANSEEWFFSSRTFVAPERVRLSPARDLLNQQVPQGSKVWVIFQHSTGIEKMILAYELAPSIVNFWYWSLGTKLDAKDVWTNAWPLEKWETELKSYDFVYIGKANEDFWQRYGKIFPPSQPFDDGSLFKIQVTKKDRIELQYVGTSASDKTSE